MTFPDKPESLWGAAAWQAVALHYQAEAAGFDQRTESGRMAYASAKAGEADALARIRVLSAEPSTTLRESAATLAPCVRYDAQSDLAGFWRAVARQDARRGNRKGAAVVRLAMRLAGIGFVAPIPGA